MMNDNFFRVLTPEETEQFKQWAKDNFVPDMKVNPVFHPVVRAELARLQAEFNAAQESVETPLGEDLDGFNEIDQGMYDDDPNPYHGDYSED